MSQHSYRQPHYMSSRRSAYRFRQRSILFLWVIVIFLLILNLALLYGLNLARLRTIETLDNVETTLDDLAHEVVVYDFEIDRAVPLKADVPFQRTMEIPVNTVIPIDQELSVPFKTPAGEIILDVPIKTDFPLDVVIPVNFNETISIDSVVQLNTTIPVEIDIAQTSLAAYLAQARLDVAQLKNRLAFKGDESIPSVELSSKTTMHYPEDKPEAAPVLVADDDTSAPAKKACSHIYWPLQPGTTWTYASQDSSYIQRVDNIVNDQAYLSTQYEGQNLQFQIGCLQQGVGLNYLGDMRRLREFGELTFSNPRGTFLPDPETMAEIGRSWTQENDITGTVEGRQGDKPLIGHITHGLARATYTPMSRETVNTPLGSQNAIRVEQMLELELELSFELAEQIIPASQIAKLMNVYWFAENIGLVKMHWQGGTLEQTFEINHTLVSEQVVIPALAEDQLVFVCIVLKEEVIECKPPSGASQSSLPAPTTSELTIPMLVFPEEVRSEANSSNSDSTSPTISNEKPDQAGPGRSPSSPSKDNKADIGAIGDTTPTSATPLENEAGQSDSRDNNAVIDGAENATPTQTASLKDEGGRSDLLAYATAVAGLGEQISEAGEDFGKAVIAYRDGQLTIEQFRVEFEWFSPTAKGLIQRVSQLSPPPEAAAIHQKLSAGLAKCDQGIDLMDQWLNTFDEGIKVTAVALVTQCLDKVTTAGDELAALVGEN